jgi:hypothetical protein
MVFLNSSLHCAVLCPADIMVNRARGVTEEVSPSILIPFTWSYAKRYH